MMFLREVSVERSGLSHTVLDIGGKIDSQLNIPDPPYGRIAWMIRAILVSAQPT
jgi:hypothetical protein